VEILNPVTFAGRSFNLKGPGWVPVDISEAWKTPSNTFSFSRSSGAWTEPRAFSIGRDLTLLS